MHSIIWLIYNALEIYSWFVWAAVILTLLIQFNIVNRYQPLVQQIGVFLKSITEPVFRQIRRVVPPLGGFDLSPLIVLLLVKFAQVVLVNNFA